MTAPTIEPSTPDGRVYFPELDGLRFIAFALVYLFHGGIPRFVPVFDSLVRWVGYHPVVPRGQFPPSFGHIFERNGWVGVQLFFLLSGFMITTLLLREEGRFGRVDLRSFWARRILRIWPLYYLIVFLTFFALPLLDGALDDPDVRKLWRGHLVPFLTFTGNWSIGVLGPFPFDTVSILWSVCVEEQFYLFCPLLIAWVRSPLRVPVVLVLMGAGIAGRYVLARGMEAGSVSEMMFRFNLVTHLDTLCAGVLLALVLARRAANPSPLWAGWKLLIGLAAIGVLFRPGLATGTIDHRAFDYVAIWLVGGAVVMASAFGGGFWGALLGHRWLVWLGRISYGLYMFHEIAFWIQRRTLDRLGWFPNRDTLITIATFALTVALAAGSYYGVERPFLRWKRRWSRVPSRPI